MSRKWLRTTILVVGVMGISRILLEETQIGFGKIERQPLQFVCVFIALISV